MKIVIAPDSFKGSLTAVEVSDAIEQGMREIFPKAEIIKIPMADGGEGTVQCLFSCPLKFHRKPKLYLPRDQ